MILQVKKTSELNGTLCVPGSKSHGIRALLIATLAKGESRLTNLLDSEDTSAALATCKALGAEIDLEDGGAIIVGSGLPLTQHTDNFFTGNSGITTRFMLPVFGLREESDKVTLNVGEQMKLRPIDPLLNALNHLGMHVSGHFPLHLSGHLTGGEVEIDGTTSQYLSALLLSLPCAKEDSVIKVLHLNERPYVEMTTRWLDEQGIAYDWEKEAGLDVFTIDGGQSYKAFEKAIPGDFSSASYLFAAQAILPGELHIEGLDMEDTQPDKALVHLLKDWPEVIDCNDFPDLLPTLAVVATQMPGKTHLTNVAQARIKETDRIHSMTQGLRAMEADIEELEDGMIVHRSDLKGAEVHGFGDHRTIMALAVAGLVAEGETKIDTAEGIHKTYPNFVQDFQSLGANMTLL